jgi:hypothetical protein
MADEETIKMSKDELEALQAQYYDLKRTHRELVSEYQHRLRRQILIQEQDLMEHQIGRKTALQEFWDTQQTSRDARRRCRRVFQIQANSRETAHLSSLSKLKQDHANRLSKIVQEHTAHMQSIFLEHHRQMQALSTTAEAERQSNMDELARSNGILVLELQTSREEELQDLKRYYNRILDTQNRLLEEHAAKLAEQRRQIKLDEKILSQLAEEHDKVLAQPIAIAMRSLKERQSIHEKHVEEKKLLNSLRIHAREEEAKIQALEIQNDQYEERLAKLLQRAETQRLKRQAVYLKLQQKNSLLHLLQEQEKLRGVY